VSNFFRKKARVSNHIPSVWIYILYIWGIYIIYMGDRYILYIWGIYMGDIRNVWMYMADTYYIYGGYIWGIYGMYGYILIRVYTH